MITGESEPVDSSVIASDPNALEARNIIFSGSLVVDGACLAVVIRTGELYIKSSSIMIYEILISILYFSIIMIIII
jgi:magnesium-transporting ATPase (P-type)